ncbi:MAG: copper chaperone PCu(A)C [Rhodoferax sp.]|jgi:copper(I)-binding protein|uniref:copper chaperone PCu(A)C n=1 Tax=Rhodoferax sp. TaxID=50421 RepID=UPI001B449688|nr:copper chaperone PCu(A)C [Rhodoferax sp.]MBP9060837.1 copper chaperone PCu(A)C [Rhodoferax sp.]MDP1530940.1 copper chaperone PCu(A)C [Rhodoferax sp.]MDP1942593.1 copper chaperone PCu(A)C [Rhodoferax sp.]MDP3193216.1 copper chaperone PCu(A)C [Rhodoferax sp.]MDP3865266.1 copper chaperone PCu(A)C [Rhodoferax sp.]
MEKNHLAGALLASCMTMTTSISHAEVAVTGAWVRATVPNQQATGAFMQLMSKKDTTLVSARSDIAGIVEVHEMQMENDVMRMRAVDGLKLPANHPVELKSGGYHLMMMDLKKQLKVGTEAQITLVFKNANGESETTYVHAPVALTKPKR